MNSTRSNAAVHANLGIALQGKGQVDEAIACYKKGIELDPKLAVARTLLANAQLMAAVQDKLLVFLKGQFQPTTNDERLGLVNWCENKKLHYAATSLYAAAFAADPKLGDDLKAGHRYAAARSASLAAAGQGEDAAKLDNAERTRLRKQALEWLRADLALRTKQLETGKPADRAEVQQTVRRLAKGHRPGRHPRRGRPGQALRRRTEGVYPALDRRRGAAEEGERPTEPRLADAATARGPQGAPQGQPATGRIARPDRLGSVGEEEVDRGRAAPPRVPGHPRADAAGRLVHLQHQVNARRRARWARRNTPTPNRCSWPATRG